MVTKNYAVQKKESLCSMNYAFSRLHADVLIEYVAL